MAINLGDFQTGILSLFTTFWIWGLIIFLFLVATIGFLLLRKRKKLMYPAIELTDLGAGKIGFKRSKAGWFKSKTILFGLLDWSGEEIMKLKDGRKVQDVSSEDFHDIDGRRGLLIIRKPEDPKILLPINKAGVTSYYKKEEILDRHGRGTGKYRIVAQDLKPVKGMKVLNEKLLLEIAPADYRDASAKIVFDAEKETMAKWEKIAPYVVFGAMGMIFLVTIILIVQMVKQGQTNAKDLILEAGRMNKDQINQLCSGMINQATEIASKAP